MKGRADLPSVPGVLGNHEKRIRGLEFRRTYALLIRKAAIAFTDDLATGVELFTLDIGDVLYDAFIVINEGFDDSGVSGNTDLQLFLGGSAWSLSANDIGFGIKTADDFSGGLALDTGSNLGQQLLQRAANLAGYGRISTIVLTEDPLIAKVATYVADGTTGQADIYVLTGTPA